ncbi:cuticle protein 21-like [Schistocerca americana]|uniref:cuticle protein 21-like n=1 Tax=Schistocerca americana TaxID=7009 RepID=UPI001F5032E1|nr:cuticle protein 21-like [Schistocerca americana]
MRLLALLCALMALCAGDPVILPPLAPYNALGFGVPHSYAALPYNYHVPPPVAAVAPPLSLKTQYHAQDEFGQASYGHTEPFQAHSAVQDAAGNKLGTYSYVTPSGQVVRLDYVADGLGFRVASNALPVAPEPPGPEALPQPVSETPEVAAARAAHLAEVAEAEARSRSRRALRPRLGLGGPETPASTAPLPLPPPPPPSPLLAYAAAPFAPFGPGYGYAYGPGLGLGLGYGLGLPAHPPLVAAAAVAVPTARRASLSRVVNNPGHAVSYRVE